MMRVSELVALSGSECSAQRAYLQVIALKVQLGFCNEHSRRSIGMEMKLELIAVPVTDVDRAKAFYEKVGFNADHDQTVNENLRFVQLTPPGSACSICIGKGLTEMTPGSIDMILLVVENADQAREDLLAKGI